jgi:ADP-ribose pyrophosphatase YjhB (NUDIX family)
VPDAVAREIAEELGLAIKPYHLLCVVDQIDRKSDEHWVAPVYLVENAEGEPQILEPAALADFGWFALTHLPSPLTRATEVALACLSERGH